MGYYWRKQQAESHRHQVGHWRSLSSHNRKPPLYNRQYSMPSWEKEFCASVGIPWGKVVETKKYMHLYGNVVEWRDSAAKEAFDKAKERFWAAINSLPCDLPLPDPELLSGNVDWDACDDPEFSLDLDRESRDPSEEERGEEVIVGLSLLMNQSLSGPGWGDDEEEATKPAEPNSAAHGWESNLLEKNGGSTGWGDGDEEWTKPAELNSASQGWESNLHENNGGPTGWGEDEIEWTKPAEPNSAAQGWESNIHENNETNSWELHYAPAEHVKEYEWQNGQNDSQGWNQKRGNYGGDFQNKFKGRNGGNGNRGASVGYNRERENMAWSRNPGYHGNEFQMNRGRRNNTRGGGGGGGGGRRGREGTGRGGGRGRGRGGRRGNFGYDHSDVDKVPSGTW